MESIKILINMGADINNMNSNNESPLSIAIVNNYEECINFFKLAKLY
jgi:ankyrin repeat protein